MKFTVIIPVYNVEKYINVCVESVLKQSCQDYEIILIDDGATDASGDICDRLKETHNQIQVIHKKNGGLSSARNAGIRSANGDYIIFLDGDDYWDDDKALEKLARVIYKYDYDVLNFHYKKFYENSQTIINSFRDINMDEFQLVPLEERKEYLIATAQFIASACNKVIKKSLFEKEELFFDEGKTSEDINWCARVLVYSKNMGVCNENFYVYRQREESITHTVKLNNLIDLKNNIQSCLKLFEKFDLTIHDSIACYNYISYMYCTSLICYHNVNDSRKKELLPEFKKNSFLLKYHRNKKVYLFYLINRCIGFYGLLYLTRIYS